MKNKIFLTLMLFVFGFTVATAQGHKGNKVTKEEIQAQKVAFMSNELSLNKTEAEKFWPVFNEYEQKMDEVHRKHRKLVKQLRDFDNLTEAEAYSKTEELIALDEERTNIKKAYLVKFSTILGKKKGAKVFYVEEKFRRELLKKIRNSKSDMPPPPPGGRP
jgi:hypothetical protein